MQLRAALAASGASFQDVRIAKHRKSGDSRGFAFIEFTSVEDARVWLTYTNGAVQVDGHTCSMEYSTGNDHDDDWYCFKVAAISISSSVSSTSLSDSPFYPPPSADPPISSGEMLVTSAMSPVRPGEGTRPSSSSSSSSISNQPWVS